MEKDSKTKILRDLKNKQLKITREFKAPVKRVWKAWTDSETLDLWWAPKPWKAKTKSMDFREGGYWLYSMVGPDGTETWGREDYKSIIPFTRFIATDKFCDEKGNVNSELPILNWWCDFFESGKGTSVQIEITFSSVADIEKIIEMGFEAGFTAALENLDELFES
jgi:uncharacterized protein YndB with AHSA1/START domain